MNRSIEGKHTSGPWQIEGRRGPGYIISHGVNLDGDGPAGYVGVLDPMFYVAGQPSDLAANVRVVVAAPDLLEALILFVRSEKLARDGQPPQDADLLLEIGEAAIAKATGQ